MAEWRGKPKRSLDDISPYWHRSPYLAKFFVQTAMPKVIATLSYEMFERLIEAVESRFGSFSAITLNRAVIEALEKWIAEQK
ncbi:MAG: hypothetical protein ACUVXA_12220 [Candidatus Jordarchaeum sp.]|uniref:hypothetical protein n=1 Tax=Candidatus Jordarchaeum sp. TaxID=2823881 RepID=UPI00404B37F0